MHAHKSGNNSSSFFVECSGLLPKPCALAILTNDILSLHRIILVGLFDVRLQLWHVSSQLLITISLSSIIDMAYGYCTLHLRICTKSADFSQETGRLRLASRDNLAVDYDACLIVLHFLDYITVFMSCVFIIFLTILAKDTQHIIYIHWGVPSSVSSHLLYPKGERSWGCWTRSSRSWGAALIRKRERVFHLSSNLPYLFLCSATHFLVCFCVDLSPPHLVILKRYQMLHTGFPAFKMAVCTCSALFFYWNRYLWHRCARDLSFKGCLAPFGVS